MSFSKLNETIFYILNIKTTGFNVDDEILAVTLVNQEGDIVLDELIKPDRKKKWSYGDENIWHNISPNDVEDNGILYHELIEKLQQIIPNTNLVVSYNSKFHTSYFPKTLFTDNHVDLCCAMDLSVGFIHHHPSYASLSSPLKLRVLADLLEIDRNDLDLKTSAGDALLCLRVWHKMKSMSSDLEFE